MITPERLKNLIEQEAMIYDLNGNDFRLSKYMRVYVDKNNNVCLVTQVIDNSVHYGFSYEDLVDFTKNLFETKEDAEFELEFGDIKRYQELKLPRFEDCFNTKGRRWYNGIYDCWWEDANRYMDFNVIINDNNFEKAYINVGPCSVQGWNKENYIKACRIAKQIFLERKY